MTTGLPQRRGAVGSRASPILAVVGVIAVAFMVVRIAPLGPPTSGNTEVESGHRSSNLQRHRRALEEEPYDIYLGLAPKKVVRPRGLQQAPETARRGLQAPLEHSISMSMSMPYPTTAPSRAPTSSPSKSQQTNPPTSSPSKAPTSTPTSAPTPTPADPCGIAGKWEPAEDICKLVVIDGGEVQGVCDKNNSLEITTDPLGTTGTLTGVKTWQSPNGSEEESVNLIGFYHDEDCSFKLVSTTSGMTIAGKVRDVEGMKIMQMDATMPGVDGEAVTQAGKFQPVGEGGMFV